MTTSWDDLCADRMAGRNDLPLLLREAWDTLSPDDQREAVGDAWTGAEAPEGHLGADEWIAYFEDVGYQVDGKPADRTTDLPELVTLCCGAIPTHARGMAWTTDRDLAQWFATRWNGYQGAQVGRLYTCTVPRDLVLARFHEAHRREAEHVLDVLNLGDDDVQEVTE